MAKVTDLVAQLAQPLAEAAGAPFGMWSMSRKRARGISGSTSTRRQVCPSTTARRCPAPCPTHWMRRTPIEGSYTLEVSSAGADRVLKKPEHFQRFCGEEVEVRLYRPKDGKKDFVGRLTGWAEWGYHPGAERDAHHV